jgi:cephalosporin hydroxylase
VLRDNAVMEGPPQSTPPAQGELRRAEGLAPGADPVAVGALIVETDPELIIQVGVEEDGGTLLYAGLLEALGGQGLLLAVGADLSGLPERARAHPRIEPVEGEAIDAGVISRLRSAAGGKRTMLLLGPGRGGPEILAALRNLAGLVSPGCYLVIEGIGVSRDRAGEPELTSGPQEALDAWLSEGPPFAADRTRGRAPLTAGSRGLLRRLEPGEEGRATPQLPDDPPSSVRAAGGLPPLADEADDVLASLRRTVWKLAEQERRLLLEVERLKRELRAVPSQFEARLAEQARLVAEKDRLLAQERLRVRSLEGWLPRRIRDRLMRLPLLRGYESRRIRELGERNDRLRRAAALGRRMRLEEDAGN